MSDQQRDAAADLEVCEAATPGRWSNECGEVFDVPPDDKSTISIEVHQRREDKQQRDANLAFVALAREALPWWIAEAERLRAELDRECLRALADEVERLKNENARLQSIVDALPGLATAQARVARKHLDDEDVIAELEKAAEEDGQYIDELLGEIDELEAKK